MPRRRPVRSLLFAALLLCASFATCDDASAQVKLPNRPIRLLVPFAPGGGVDVVARIVGQKITEQTGQPVLIESKPGAGGALAVNELMRSEPDGTTLLATTNSHATLPVLSRLPWHPSNDFTPIAGIYSTMLVMPTNVASTSRFKTFAEFMAYVRANPGKINWGSSGIAGPQHLAGAQFAKIAKVDMVHVPYRGNNPMVQALLQNDVQLTFDTPTLSLPHIVEGRFVPLAVTGERRMTKLPDVPTVKESGIDYTSDIRIFVLGPKGIAEPIQAALNKEFTAALDNKEVRERLTGFGLDVAEARENTPANLKRYIDDFASTYGKLIDEMGIKAE
ncbi:Bug family tripartite tricarboxylate transporter substrate binding protein [Rhodoplanes sp. Z2-YC6860]|uniref:Bug family tripartite tricarboxylate transporter substrate binding protein n=1 Tax=Rhodoplanes sp. Z2-YC6860 TaxID=674703 RepID=UPI00078CB2D0|nr:tripartite tricarboxylate transporter substrate binding protein [Rhodoplanes sp. Z2-YC6860]AMN41028.1 TTT family tricarboxylate transporter, receptor protein [Rhodoplanes sp. Z2-YC6860]